MPDSPVFPDKAQKPSEEDLALALGKAHSLWKAIRKHVSERHGPAEEEWKFYSEKSGWQLKLLLKKRNLFFLVPKNGFFRLIFVFGDKAVAAVDRSSLPENLRQELRKAKRYAEGKGLRIDIKDFIDVEVAKKLIDIKVTN